MSSDKPDGLVRHGILLMLAAQIANASNILFHVVMGRALTHDYSTLLTLLNVMLIIGIPLESLRTFAAHFSARAMQTRNPGSIHTLVRVWGLRCLSVGLLLGGMMFAFRADLAHWLHLESTTAIAVSALVIPGLFLIPLLGGVLQGMQSFVWMALALQSHSVLRFVGGALVVWVFGASALTGLSGQILGVAFAVAIGFIGYRIHVKEPALDRDALEGSGAYLGRSLVALTAFALLMMLDVPLVKHFANDEAEVFSRAATLARSIVFLPMPIAFAMFPKVVSGGRLDESSRLIFWKAIWIVLGLLACGLSVCLLLPGIPYRILYGPPTPEAESLVRHMVLALTPLALVYLLLNFEMAQHRFRFLPSLCIATFLYAGGVSFVHRSAADIAGILGLSSLVASIGMIATLPWRDLMPKRST